jgi:hypothetical protein
MFRKLTARELKLALRVGKRAKRGTEEGLDETVE